MSEHRAPLCLARNAIAFIVVAVAQYCTLQVERDLTGRKPILGGRKIHHCHVTYSLFLRSLHKYERNSSHQQHVVQHPHRNLLECVPLIPS